MLAFDTKHAWPRTHKAGPANNSRAKEMDPGGRGLYLQIIVINFLRNFPAIQIEAV